VFSLWKYLEAISNFVIENCPNCSNILQQDLIETYIQAKKYFKKKCIYDGLKFILL